MSLASRPNDDSLPPDDLARVIAVCDRFEADLNAGRPRRIEDDLAAVADETSRTRLFRELLALDIELARRAGRPRSPMPILLGFPTGPRQSVTSSMHSRTPQPTRKRQSR